MIADTVISLTLKVAHAVLSFATIRALVEHWGLQNYGIWVTFTAVAAYMAMFDLGIGYGIRNKVAEYWEREEKQLAGTTIQLGLMLYAVAALVGLAVAVAVTFTVDPFNRHPAAALVLWSSCALSFLLSLYTIILQALGQFRIIAILSLVMPLGWYAFVRGWTVSHALSMETAACAYSAAMLLQAGLLTWASVRRHHIHIFKRFQVDLTQAYALIKTGLQFFVLQVTSLALSNSGNILVYTHLGAADTAQYDAANKVFSMFTFGFSVLIGIAWTEISRAKSRADHKRLMHIFKILHAVAVMLTGVGMACALFSEPMTQFLTGVKVGTAQTMAFAIMVGIQMLAYSSTVFLNAFEQLRVQLIAALIGIPIFFGTSLLLLRTGSSFSAVPMATAASALPALIMCLITVRRLLARERARYTAAHDAMPRMAA
jgi:O-antigen/teichoic acid export membrane protein